MPACPGPAGMAGFMPRKKVLFIIPHMTGGGAERFLSVMLKFLDRKRFEPVLVLYSAKGISYKLPADVRIVDLGMDGRGAGELRKAWYFFRRIRAISGLIDSERPAAVFGMLAGPIPIMSGRRAAHRARIIIRETTFPSLGLRGVKGWVHKRLLSRYYPKADLIIALTRDARKDLEDSFGVPAGKITVIQNPLDLEEIRRKSAEAVPRGLFGGGPVLVAAGRLTELKGYSYLLKAFAMLARESPARLLILGEGEERQKFEELAAGLGISGRVRFLGFDRNPFRYMGRASAFVFPSLYEGFPNVIIEAMACGAPVISTDCQSGPSEIITDGKDGLLVPVRDEKALYLAMKKMLGDAKLRKRLAAGGRRRALDFEARKIMRRYEAVLG